MCGFGSFSKKASMTVCTFHYRISKTVDVLSKSHIKVIMAHDVTQVRLPCPTDLSELCQQMTDGGLSKLQPTQGKYKASRSTSSICSSAAFPLSDV